MTWFADLTKYSYIRWVHEPTAVNIGWLDQDHPYLMGPTTPEFQERLTFFCHNPPERFVTKGSHACEFCGRVRGGNEIRVIGDEKTYAAPVLVFHYVIVHEYRPPDEFIEAVMRAPLPDSDEMVSRYGFPLPHRFPEKPPSTGQGKPPSTWRQWTKDPANKAVAINAYRQERGGGLAEAKRVVEAFIRFQAERGAAADQPRD
jgi:hypothetical protein